MLARGSSSMTIPARLSQKMLPHFRCDLRIGHLVSGFRGRHTGFESAAPDAPFQLTFCLPRSKYLNGVCSTHDSDHLIVVAVELARILSVPLILHSKAY